MSQSYVVNYNGWLTKVEPAGLEDWGMSYTDARRMALQYLSEQAEGFLEAIHRVKLTSAPMEK